MFTKTNYVTIVTPAKITLSKTHHEFTLGFVNNFMSY